MSKSDGPVKGVTRPIPLAVNLDGIPSELLLRPRWVNWRYQWQKDAEGCGGKWKKPPFAADDGRAASVTDPDTWSHVDAAVSKVNEKKADGIGLVLADERGQDGDLTPYVLDIDGCRNPETGEIDSEALKIVMDLNSWTEVSPSGRGVHVWFWASLRVAGRRQGRYEVYGDGRYIALTGVHVLGSPLRMEERQAQIEAVMRDHFGEKRKPDGAGIVRTVKPIGSAPMSSEEVIKRCSSSVGGERFKSLYGGNAEGFVSQSDADLGFCSRLAFYTQDVSQIVAIWRGSGMWRDKCDEPRKEGTYATLTAQKAINTQTNYHDPNFRSGKPRKVLKYQTGPTPADVRPTTPQPVSDNIVHRLGGEKPSKPLQAMPGTTSNPEPEADPFCSLETFGDEKTDWFLHPWIPKGELSFVVGRRNCGKSCFMAHLISRAKLALVFGAAEESVAKMFKPRILAHGGRLERVKMAPDKGWTFPSCERRLIEAISRMGCDLVILDPIDSYMDSTIAPNDAAAVRSLLESIIRVARQSGAAVVAIRHPGKQTDNICPGSAAWQNVPRHIVQLLSDGRKPPRRYLNLPKDSLGTGACATHYELVPKGTGNPPIFTLGRAVVGAEAEVAAMVDDIAERTQIDYAAELIRDYLSDGPQEADSVLKLLKAVHIGSSTAYMAKRLLGVTHNREGSGLGTKSMWIPPAKWPEGYERK